MSPLVAPKEMKLICNQPANFVMIAGNTNQSTHREIDNKLMKDFEEMIFPKFLRNEKYRFMWQLNPSKLELEVKSGNISAIRLGHSQSTRAKLMAKRVQELGFPPHYTAFARLFYRCFRDLKDGHIWSDNGNQKEFKQYLQSQLSTDQSALQNYKEEQRIDDVSQKENKKLKLNKLINEGKVYL